ncbi:MAG: hypothetical protein KBD83_02465 [Gammaproteobacteria bacterium]|nr:hypothetical protein [Gammaproteobacteria bacterium]
MLIFNNAKRGFSSIPRLLPLNSTLTRFKIWETEKLQKPHSVDSTIHSVSIETGRIYASLDQDKVNMVKKDKEFEYCFFRSIPLGTELKNFIINEHVLNGKPNHVITLQGLNSESIENMLSYFLYRGHRYGTPMWVGGINGFSTTNDENITQLLNSLLVQSGIESILGQSIPDDSESGLVKSLIEAEKIEKNQGDNVLRYELN